MTYRDADDFKPAEQEIAVVVSSGMIMDFASAKYLYLTLYQCEQQLENSSMVMDLDNCGNQPTVNNLLGRDVRHIMNKLESVFPSLKEICKETD